MKNIKYILGISLSSDSGAVLFKKNNMIGAISESRIVRKIKYKGFPFMAIQECLDHAGITTKDIDLIAIANSEGIIAHKGFSTIAESITTKQSSLLNKFINYYKNKLADNIFAENIDHPISRSLIMNNLDKLGLADKKTIFIDHHLSHVYTTYIGSGFDKSLIITLDGFGDGLSGLISQGNNGKVTVLSKISFRNSVAFIYGILTILMGFNKGDENKLISLSSYGDPERCLNFFQNLISFNKGKILISRKISITDMKKLVKKEREYNIAASLQYHVENVLSQFVEFWLNNTAEKNLCLAGGLFNNIKINSKISGIKSLQKIFISPVSGNVGISIGAAYSALLENGFKIEKPRSYFLSKEFLKSETEIILKKRGIKYTELKNSEEKIAELLLNKKIVARFSGKMEFGPHSFGNRTIFFDGLERKMGEIMNLKLMRNSFIPFGPVILEEDIDKYIIGFKKEHTSYLFKTFSYKATEALIKKSPAAVHVDGSTRPLFISKTQNPNLYDIFSEVYKKAEDRIFVHTGFNLHGEPIVYTPSNAISTFFKIDIDYLVFDNFLISIKQA